MSSYSAPSIQVWQFLELKIIDKNGLFQRVCRLTWSFMVYNMNILAIYFLPNFIFKLSVFCKQQWFTFSFFYSRKQINKIFTNESLTWFQDIHPAHQMSRSFYSAIEQGQRFGMWVLRMAQFIWNWCSTNLQFRNDFWGLPFLDGVLKENPRLFSSWLDFFFYALGVDNHR